MMALWVLFLAGSASFLLFFRGPALLPPSRTQVQRKNFQRNGLTPEEALPRLVRQMAALLAAGRTGPALWDAMAHVLVVEHQPSQPSAPRPSQQPQMAAGGLPPPRAGPVLEQPKKVQINGMLLLVLAVQRASALGLPTAAAIRSAGNNAAVARLGRKRSLDGALNVEQLRMWRDVAACFEVCEASGAAVASVLERLANTMEADHDAAALRDTALAGPRATVRLLSWLPFIGLGLGILMGVDPVAALFGSPVGWAVLAAGVGFAVAGRAWSARMIADAARPVRQSDWTETRRSPGSIRSRRAG